jgi:hypothetical protein
MKYLVLAVILVMVVITITEAQATDDSTQLPKDAPNFHPTITKDPTNENMEIVEFKCKLKAS